MKKKSNYSKHSLVLCSVPGGYRIGKSSFFLQCPFARVVWFASKEGILTDPLKQLSVEQWLKVLIFDICKLSGVEQSRSLHHIGILWLIWKHRCDIVFRGVKADLGFVIKNVGELVQQWQKAAMFRKQSGAMYGINNSLWRNGARDGRETGDSVFLSGANVDFGSITVTKIQSDGSWVKNGFQAAVGL